MKIVITPVYSDIFEGEKPNYNTLLEDIPSEIIIVFLSLINAKLYSGGHSFKAQFEIFDLFMRRQPNEIKSQIILKASQKIKQNNNELLDFFSPLYCMEFIHREILNYREFYFEDTTPEQEMNIFKAYFLVVEDINKVYYEAYEMNDKLEDEYFRKNTWPTLINQIETTSNLNYIPGMVKALAFFNFLEYHSPYSECVRNFLDLHEKKTSWNYTLDLLQLITTSWDNHKNGKISFFPFSFENIKGYDRLFEHFTLNIEEYKKNYNDLKKNFSGLKEKPLYKSSITQSRIVLNWNFITNKLYDGLLFDFYNHSGIKTKFKNFLSFKEYLSRELIEKFIFRRLIKPYIEDKRSILFYDEEDSSPDCYCRNNNRIFLIEIKDSYFPSLSIDSLSYPKIKEAIDAKYNNPKKGTGQLIRNIKKLINEPYKSDNYLEKGRKTRNLIIFPIIIYTDKFFGVPGINKYLNEEFDRKLTENNLRNNFKCIKPLTFIGLNFLIDFVDKASQLKLSELIERYYLELSKRNRKFDKTNDLQDFFDVNDNFETIFYNLYKSKIIDREQFVKSIMTILHLTEGLPKQ